MEYFIELNQILIGAQERIRSNTLLISVGSFNWTVTIKMGAVFLLVVEFD